MNKIDFKTEEELKIMAEGGVKLKHVKETLRKQVAIGVSAMDIEELACELIKKVGGVPSFKMVPGYSWATCVNINEEVVHGIPKKEKVFRKGDVVSVDVGIYYKGFHTDTSFTVGLGTDNQTNKFLEIGKKAFNEAVSQVKIGKYIYDISKAMEKVILEAGYTPIRSLVGHGIGKQLHEAPQIPCFVPGPIKDSQKIVAGMGLAVEVMYALGSYQTQVLEDGWTIVTQDGKISALFEETLAVTENGVKILTA